MALSRRRASLLSRLHARRTREREGLFLVEGVRAVEEALATGADVRWALRSPRLEGTERGRALGAALGAAGIEVEAVDDAELARAADTDSPQGVVAVCGEPGWGLDALAGEGGRPRILILDAVQDPGNAGTLVRTASAFGLSGVAALDGTVDPWSPKTVRASAGAIFRVPVAVVPWEEAAPWLAARGVPLLAAEPAGSDVADVAGRRGGGAWALAVGNEGAGLRPALRERAAEAVAIPMPGDAESLNAGVAGSILLYALARARGRNGEDA